MDCCPGSSVHGISQASILERAAISSSRGPSRPRDWTHVFHIGRWILYCWATWEALNFLEPHFTGLQNEAWWWGIHFLIQDYTRADWKSKWTHPWTVGEKRSRFFSFQRKGHFTMHLLCPLFKKKKIENQQRNKIPLKHIGTTLITFQCPWMATISFHHSWISFDRISGVFFSLKKLLILIKILNYIN